MKTTSTLKAIFFDLDGTVLDTAPDLLNACNYVLKKHQRQPIAIETFRHYISAGTKSMICHSFGIDDQHPHYVSIREEFLNCYQETLTVSTSIFPEMEQVLDFLDQNQLPWGIVTGKSTALTKPLLEHFGLAARCHCLVGGDTVSPGKPDPAPLLHACALLNLSPADCIYIGDEVTDISAAKAANMKAIAVTYGYRSQGGDPFQWKADHVVTTPLEILKYLEKQHDKH